MAVKYSHGWAYLGGGFLLKSHEKVHEPEKCDFVSYYMYILLFQYLGMLW